MIPGSRRPFGPERDPILRTKSCLLSLAGFAALVLLLWWLFAGGESPLFQRLFLRLKGLL